MFDSFNPAVATDWRAVCGKTACTVRWGVGGLIAPRLPNLWRAAFGSNGSLVDRSQKCLTKRIQVRRFVDLIALRIGNVKHVDDLI